MIEFLKCKHCGQIIKKVVDSGVDVVCCGEKMEVLTPNTTDAAREKHVPEVSVEKNIVTVKVGSVEHPMTEMHYIEWIIIETSQGSYKYNLKPTSKPECKFILREDEVFVKAYAYCNLHGLWMA
ncbi:MAG: desulfoferrodoxin Dfx [bacterium]|nr:desulfoferrodoxin Dfx [bacterium]